MKDIKAVKPLKNIRPLGEVVNTYILRALVTCEFSQVNAAKLLQINRATVMNRVRLFREQGYDIPNNQTIPSGVPTESDS